MYHKGLNHDFAVITNEELAKEHDKYIFFLPEKLSSEIVQLHDDLIAYFSDNLKWLTTLNPHKKNQSYQGLCTYGDTVFTKELVTPFKQLLMAWRLLYANAPMQFELTGGWTTIEGKKNSGKYAKIPVNRDELFGKFDKLIAMCEQVENDENFVLLHGGI